MTVIHIVTGVKNLMHRSLLSRGGRWDWQLGVLSLTRVAVFRGHKMAASSTLASDWREGPQPEIANKDCSIQRPRFELGKFGIYFGRDASELLLV
jgi:hypothetical protein